MHEIAPNLRTEPTAPILSPLYDPQLDPLFWRASRTGVVSAWTKHVPFAHWIVATVHPRSIVELGAHNGVSYAAFCEAVQRSQLDCRCLAVDTWQGDEHAGFYGEEVFQDLQKFHDLRYAGFSELLRSTFDDALDYVADGSVDLLHIDGLHTYAAVQHDYELWRPKLTERGVVLLHDTNVRERGFGVWRLFEELALQFPAFQFFHGHGLGMLMVGPQADPSLLELSNLSGAAASSLRERFSLLGERWDAEMRVAIGRQDWVEAQQGLARERSGFEGERQHLLARTDALATELAAQKEKLTGLQAANADTAASLRNEREVHGKALSAAVAAAEQRSKEERRLRAMAAARTAEFRKEMVAATAAVSSQAARAEAAEAALGMASAAADSWRQQAEASGVEREQFRARLEALQTAFRIAASDRDRLLASPFWRVTWPLRAGGLLIPGPIRRTTRRVLTAAWWAVTGQLGPQLARRRAVLEALRHVMASPLFDPAWYVAANPDCTGMTPEVHYVTIGGLQHRDPGPGFSTARYLQQHPDAAAPGQVPLLHLIAHGHQGDWAVGSTAAPPDPAPPAPETGPTAIFAKPAASGPPPDASACPPSPDPPPLRALLQGRFAALEPLRTFSAPHDGPRVTIVTDSVNTGSLYGGVGTALILAVLLARRLGATFRLVTRTEPPDAGNIDKLLHTHGVSWDGNVELLHAPPGSGRDVPVSPYDVFLTTSWWSTWATSRAVAPGRIAYLLQEDERGFYPLGDDHLRAGEMMGDPALLHVVNTKLLLGHLQADKLAPGGVAFEPAFPIDTYHRSCRDAKRQKNFFFYARPYNPRNLYWRGLEAIGRAVEEGVLDSAKWRFYFVGKAADRMVLPDGTRPEVVHDLPWAEYAGLVRRMDLGLSLMSTPHPSYPPLDLAASGAVVVTNRFGRKDSLVNYSANILTAEPTTAGLVDGLRRGVTLVEDEATRAANYTASELGRDWQASFAPVLDRLAERFGRSG